MSESKGDAMKPAGTTIECVESPPQDWDPFVEASARSTFCHLAGWQAVMTDLMGHECYYVVARNRDGDLVGGLPLVRVKSLLFGDHLISMPFLNYGGPLGSQEVCTLLVRSAKGLGDSLGTGLLELRTRYPVEAPDLEQVARKVTVVLPLPDAADVLWNDVFYSKLRTKLRRAGKEDFQVRMGQGLVDDFFRVFSRNMRDLGTPVLPPEFFRRLPEVFGGRVIVAVTYHRETPVAAACGFMHGGEFELTWSSAIREYNRLNPNMFMYWKLMDHIIESGGRAFNFGRSTPGSGTHQFKLSWGGHDESLPWLVHSSKGSTRPPTPDDTKFALAIRAWRLLPVGLTRIIGPLLSPYLP